MSRRDVLRLGGAIVAGSLVTPGIAAARDSSSSGGNPVLFLSDQLATVPEEAALRNHILSGFKTPVNFITFSETTQFIDSVIAQSKAGTNKVDLIGGLQGDFVSLASQVKLRDMSDVLHALSNRHFPPQYLKSARIGGAPRFVPWIQASYLMVANKQALRHLPPGKNVNHLTYNDLLAWAQKLQKATGRPLLGFPASPDGLIKRFFQGNTYPSFTGGLNTTFKSPAAVNMWNWFKQTWAASNPQSVTYSFMQEQLLSGEVWVAWDHAVRLIDALKSRPNDFVAFPPPRGPKGLGYEPVLGGLAIPETSKNVDAAKALIAYLTEPKTTANMLKLEAWFPPVGVSQLPSALPSGERELAHGIETMVKSPHTIVSALPVGLGAQSDAYDKVFTDTFTAIAINNSPVASTLQQQAVKLQSVLRSAHAACWAPDPASHGVCRVG